jgi:hypothetical protein
MSVQRFRDIADVPPVPATNRIDPATIANMKAVLSLSSHLLPLFAPGVYRYRSIDEANAARDEAELARMRAMRIDR